MKNKIFQRKQKSLIFPELRIEQHPGRAEHVQQSCRLLAEQRRQFGARVRGARQLSAPSWRLRARARRHWTGWCCQLPGHKVHKVHLYRVAQCVGIGTPPAPLSCKWVCPFPPSPEPNRGQTRLRVMGWGSPNSDDWRKSLALCLLCVAVFLTQTSNDTIYKIRKIFCCENIFQCSQLGLLDFFDANCKTNLKLTLTWICP